MKLLRATASPFACFVLCQVKSTAFVRPHRPSWYTRDLALTFTDTTSCNLSSGTALDAEPNLPGRVHNITQWLIWSDRSLSRVCTDGKGGIFDRVNTILRQESGRQTRKLTSTAELHASKRFAILSHGNQTDPVYNYVNAAGFDVFQWPAEIYHRLPSRFSAPDGHDRRRRASVIQSATTQPRNTTHIDTAVRIRYPNATVTLNDAILWNVFNDDGVRVGQTVLFDAQAVEIHSANKDDWDFQLVPI